jgi:sulfonate transport system permease protein
VSQATASPQVAPAAWSSPVHSRHRWLPRLDALAPAAFVVAVLAVWQFGGGHFLNPRWVSSPALVFARLADWFATGQVWIHVSSTLEGTLLGFVVGALLGLLLGSALGLSRTFQAVAEPYVVALYSLPSLALAPLFVVWFGISLVNKVAFAALAVMLLVTFITFQGIRDVPRDLIVAIRLMGARPRQVLFKVMLPAATGSILLGLRTSVPMALRATVFGELIGSTAGIGFTLNRAAQINDVTTVFAALFVLGVLGVILDLLLGTLEHHLMPVLR